MLTQKQEKFVQELIKGKSQRAAYKEAYDCKNMKDSTIDQNASRLFKDSKVSARFNELNKAAIAEDVDEAVRMRAFIIEKYQKIASGEICEETTEYDADGNVTRKKKTVRPNDVNNAIAKLAEYYGVAPEEKVQNEITITINGGDDYAD